jgi:tripartite-type tricarboxylate transporter receptor subunit TctC
VLPSLKTKLPYDIQKDFVLVGMGARYPIVLVVHPSLPVKFGQEPVAMSPEEFAAFLDNEIKKWSKTIQTAGIKPE